MINYELTEFIIGISFILLLLYGLYKISVLEFKDGIEKETELLIKLDGIESILKKHKTLSPNTHYEFIFKGEKWELVKLADKE